MRARIACMVLVSISCAQAPAREEPAVASLPQPAPAPWSFVAPFGGDARVEPEWPKVAHHQLKNGLEIILLEDRSLPLTAIALVAIGGAAHDGDTPGAAYLAQAVWSSEAIQKNWRLWESLTKQGARFGGMTAPDHVRFVVLGPGPQLPIMMEALASVTRSGRITRETLERRRNALVSRIWEERAIPTRRAENELRALVFGGRHPYGHPLIGHVQTLARLDQAKLEAIVAKMLCPERTALIAAGGIELEQVSSLAKMHLGEWKRCSAKSSTGNFARSTTPQPRSEIVLVDAPGRTQVRILASLALAPAAEVNVASLEILVEALGGSMSSRLQARLRDQGSYTYGAFSALQVNREGGQLHTQTDVDGDRIQEALPLFLDVFASLARKVPTQDEIDATKRRLASRLVQRMESSEGLLDLIASRFAAGLPTDTALAGDGGREAVTSTAQALFDPLQLQIVLVGDAAKIGAKVEALNIGRVRIVRR